MRFCSCRWLGWVSEDLHLHGTSLIVPTSWLGGAQSLIHALYGLMSQRAQFLVLSSLHMPLGSVIFMTFLTTLMPSPPPNTQVTMLISACLADNLCVDDLLTPHPTTLHPFSKSFLTTDLSLTIKDFVVSSSHTDSWGDPSWPSHPCLTHILHKCNLELYYAKRKLQKRPKSSEMDQKTVETRSPVRRVHISVCFWEKQTLDCTCQR